MILVDTSVWVDHLRYQDAELVRLLEAGRVLCHPFVVGELACGHLRGRRAVLALLRGLPSAPRAHDHEVLWWIEAHALMGRGLGYIDMHLLVSIRLEPEAALWTHDRRLGEVAAELGLAYGPRASRD